MTITTTTRGVLLRRAGTLLVAATLAGAPAASAFADPTDPATPTSTASAASSPSAPAEPSPDPSSPTPSPSPSVPAPTAPSPSPSATATTLAPGGDHRLAGASDTTLLAATGTAAPQTVAAADFVARTLAAGDDHYVYPDSTYFDGGNTIDAIIALAGSGTGATQAAESLQYLEDNLDVYVGSGGEAYAGPIAKTLLAVVVAGGDPTSFGGVDLVADLEALESEGRFSDASAYGDYSNTIGQSLALIALLRAGQTVSTASVDVLLDQQCADGGFRGALDGDACVSDPDATAFAAQALIAAGSTAAAEEAVAWLAAAQADDGSLESADGIPNANTTGVAAQAFAAAGRDAELAAAQGFLASLQYGCAAPAAVRGGLAFSASTRSTTEVTDSDLRATPQATLGLSGKSLLSATLAGAAETTTGLECAGTSSPTPSTTSSAPTQPAATETPTSGSVADGAGRPGAGVPTGSLAQTGSDLLLPLGLGIVLVLVGGLAVWATSRRRGAHA